MTQHEHSDALSNGTSVLNSYLSAHDSPIFRGIEKEGLRVEADQRITQSDHPSALGQPLTHRFITTDYSEALLELITGVSQDRDTLLAELEAIHHFVQRNIGDQVLWAGSMPCALEGDASIRIAEYGSSNIGTLKHVYRQGLGVRYGRIMQSIAGLHFNFSLDDSFWETLKKTAGDDSSLQDFKSQSYFGLIRNFRRHAWLLMYLFGASPALDKSFVAQNNDHGLEQLDSKGTLYKPYACSLRMGDLGYHNNAQADLNICFNTLENFTTTLGNAIRTPYPEYEAIGLKQDGQFVQLNTNILQIENEYYSSIRPKRTTFSGEKPTQALIDRGVEYVEVRCLDLNPMEPLGISASQIDFMDVFLLHCLLSPSDYINEQDCRALENNFSKVVNEGRRPGLELEFQGQSRTLSSLGLELLEQMDEIANTLDAHSGDERYQAALSEQRAKLQNPSLTPSAQILEKMKSESISWLEFGQAQSSLHQAAALDSEPSSKAQDFATDIQKEVQSSFDKAAQIEQADAIDFAEFLSQYNLSQFQRNTA